MRLLVIAHDHLSPLGPVGERFTDRGWDLDVHLVVGEDAHLTPGVKTDFPDPLAYDAVLPMGAPWSTYDHDLVGSWVRPEVDLLRRADRAGVPVLGICFGGQLLATAHGGSVTESSHPEIGWIEVETLDPSLVQGGPWFAWHYDAWKIPPGAQEVASNDAASQAFVLRQNLAVQFHPELTSMMLEGWLDGGGAARAEAFGLDLEVLLAATRAADERTRQRAHALVDGFLHHLVDRRSSTEPVHRYRH